MLQTVLLTASAVLDSANVVADSLNATTGSNNWPEIIATITLGVLSILTLLGFSVYKKISSVSKEISDIFLSISNATKDGKVTSEEIIGIKNELLDVKNALLAKQPKK